jgi:hypothetical protein
MLEAAPHPPPFPGVRPARLTRQANLIAKINREANAFERGTGNERAIDSLTPQQMEELYEWLDQRHPQSIDVLLKAELDAGRIDDRISRVLADHKTGNTSSL